MNSAPLQTTPSMRPTVSVECSNKPLPLAKRLRALVTAFTSAFVRRNAVSL